ncbi:MAG: transcription termination/antitermination protein NusG [Mycoplasmataceae bacterium]|nr:transcription termination/antitermination protein NusG [Mycoplasmataceae bacterium]
MENNIENAQWYVITAIGGKEDSIASSIKEKIHNYGYDNFIGSIRVFKTTKTTEDIFNKDSLEIPKNLKNTKTTHWEVTKDGKYKRVKTRVTNKFPGYIFINMVYDRDVWYAIRNTPGVLGFVGSSGKGAIPIPIAIEEYNAISDEQQAAPTNNVDASNTNNDAIENVNLQKEEVSTPTEQILYTTEAKIGDTVEILDGSFNGMSGEIRSLDNTKGAAMVDIDMFGRTQSIEVPYTQFKVSI